MSPLTMVSYGPSQQLHPLSLLAQMSSRLARGCLHITDGATTWMLYLEQGRLTFATSSKQPFERLDRHLRQLSRQVPGLVSAVRVQVRLLFESSLERSHNSPDYRAIRWLVDQSYLDRAQAATLIEALAQEVIESFLTVTEGSYELLETPPLETIPALCQLELRPLVEHCQTQLRQRQTLKGSTQNPPLTNSQEAKQRQDLGGLAGAPKVGSAVDEKLNLRHNPREVGKSSATANNTLKGHYIIACIDDSPTILQAIKSFLDDASFTVIMINDPIKALMQIIRSKPDIILLDVGMPNLDGYELCSLLRRHASFKHIPIVMVTGNTGFIDRAKAKLVGASGYLTKPFTQSELLKMVFKHLA